MIAVPMKYQTSFFGNLADLKPSADTIPPLLQIFREQALLPSTYQQVQLGPSLDPQVRLRLSSTRNEWIIEFDIDRITIEKNSIKPLGANMGLLEDFARTSEDYLGRILSLFPRKGTRLSLVTDGLMDQMTEEGLQEVYSRILVPLGYYHNNPPHLWNSRCIARGAIDMAQGQESINVITQVNRVQGKFLMQGGIGFDRIQVIFDINTFQDNMQPRFDIEAVRAYNTSALQLRETILTDLRERLNG
ncbi:MAG: hypothetical protein JXA73_22420 [Acidobacteria bacterium]|nr:hypothetical protein [Acidobacteriota bacterium]